MVKTNQNYDVNYKLRQSILNSQGGSNLEDINSLKRRVSLLEQNKQDNLIAGQGILISGNNIAAKNIINDTIDSLTTVWSSRKIKDILNSFSGRANVVISDSLPSESEAIENTMYYIGDSAPYNIWFFLNGDYIDVGTTDVNLEDYYTKIEINELLDLKVDKEEGKVLIPVTDLTQITTNKEDILDLEDTKLDKEEGKTLISIQDLNKLLTLESDISDLIEGKVDKEQGKRLISEANITQIATNKDDIYNLNNNKVDKVSGKSLVLDSDIAQITTNKNSITSLSMNKQDKLTAGTRIILNGNEINTVEFINDSITSATNTWSANKIKGLFDSLSGKIEVRIVAAKPENPINSTMYYVGSTAPYDIWFYVNDEYTYFGTTDIDLSNYYTKSEVDDLLDNKVDKVAGKSLVLDADIAQITTNKNDIVSLGNEKVDKEVGKSLVSDTDIAQISTNKTNIATLQNNKQDKISDSTLDSVSDSTTVSSVDAAAKTNKTFTLSALWNYIKGKITGGASTILTSNLTTNRALVSNSNGKVGVSAVTSTELGKLSGVTNTLKLETFTGNNAFTFTNADTNLQSLADWNADIPRKAWRMNGVVGLSFHLKCNCTFNISGGWIYLGTVPSGLRPKAQTAVLVSAWSAAATRPVNGFIQTDGKIKIWVDNLPVNSNTQFRMNATWSTV